MLKAEFNGKLFDILDGLSITKASNEVNFNDLVIDFTGHTIDELPIKYQEIKIVNYEKVENEYAVTEVMYNGFLEDYKTNARKNESEDIELSMTLLTPMKMATARYVTLTGSYILPDLIERILQPLINDGFNLKTNDVPERNHKVNWSLKSIENAMNILSNTYNLWWYIDEKKNIYVHNIENLLNKNAKIEITKENILDGMYEFVPELNTENYANQLSIKNARVVRRAEGCGVGSNAYPRVFFDRLTTLYNNEEYEFDNPIVFYKSGEYSNTQVLFRLFTNNYAIYVTGMGADGTITGYYYTRPVYSVDGNGNVTVTSYQKKVTNQGMAVQADGTSEEDEEKYIILFKRDSFFKNLITGFKFNGTKSTISYAQVSPYTDTALVYEIYTIKDKGEIARKKGVVSDTGIIETVIDANDKWFTENQLYLYAINQLDMLKTDTTQVTIKVDKDPIIEIGDVVSIDWIEFFVKDKFICTNITENIEKTEPEPLMDWEIKLVNAEMNNTFIDIFRAKEEEESEDKTIYNVYGVYDSEQVDENVSIKRDEVIK